MTLDPDFEEFIAFLNQFDVSYMIVGGYAMAFHGRPRYTGDLDIWIDISESNAQKMLLVVANQLLLTNEQILENIKAIQNRNGLAVSVSFSGRIKDGNNKQQIKLTKHLTPENCPLFFEIWKKINYRTRYKVEYSTEKLIEKAVANLKDFNKVPPTKRPLLEAKRASLSFEKEGIKKTLTDIKRKRVNDVRCQIPDVYAYIQGHIDITRQTVQELA